MKVLIPVQDNVFGDAITDFIAKHKWSSDTQFKLITVIEYTTYGEMLNEMNCCETTRAIYNERQATAQKLLEEYAQKIDYAMPGAFVQHGILYGQPKEVILHAAEEWGADMIVMGSHARTGLSRFLLGSVSTSVLSQAPCSVVIVKLSKEHHAPTTANASIAKADQHNQTCRAAV